MSEKIEIAEVQTESKGMSHVLLTKNQLIDNNGNFIGISGVYVDITGYLLVKKRGKFDSEKQRFYLGDLFQNEYLTYRELEVFRSILYGYTLKKIAGLLNISPKTVRWYVRNLKLKLQVSSKGEIMSVAIKYGLSYILEEHEIWKNHN